MSNCMDAIISTKLLSWRTMVRAISFLSFCSLFLFSSCALISGQRSTPTTPLSGVVPKVQYDELLQKYEALVKEREKRIDGQTLLNQAQAENSAQRGDSSVDTPKGNQDKGTDTVDFNASIKEEPVVVQKAQSPRPAQAMPATSEDEGTIENEIQQLLQGIELVKQGRFDESMKFFKPLEHSYNLQVRVRARFWVGEIFFAQKEFDLAMQVYEEILKKYAFSGLVPLSLDRLVICAENLKLPEQLQRYQFLQKAFAGKV